MTRPISSTAQLGCFGCLWGVPNVELHVYTTYMNQLQRARIDKTNILHFTPEAV